MNSEFSSTTIFINSNNHSEALVIAAIETEYINDKAKALAANNSTTSTTDAPSKIF